MEKCIVDGCENERMHSRKYCREHYLERKRSQAKLNYACGKRHVYNIKCELCGKNIKAVRNTQKLCLPCYKKVQSALSEGVNNYENARGGGYCWMHRKIAEEIIGRKLQFNEIVHHINLNPKDNSLYNLIIMDRASHIALHSHLKFHASMMMKNDDTDAEKYKNCHVISETFMWLNTNNIKIVKLSDIV